MPREAGASDHTDDPILPGDAPGAIPSARLVAVSIICGALPRAHPLRAVHPARSPIPISGAAAREVSRLARNSREWQQLVEVCRVVDAEVDC